MKDKRRKAYTSDLTDDEWDRIKHLIKQDNYCGGKGRTKFSRREMLNAIFYILKARFLTVSKFINKYSLIS